MAFFDELKKNLSGVTDTVAKTSENVMKKSSTAIEIQKAKLKRVSLEGDMKELYASLGKLYFEEYADAKGNGRVMREDYILSTCDQ